MKLSMSNIAWNSSEDVSALQLLKAFNASGVEIAPTVLWGSWDSMDLSCIEEYGKMIFNKFHLEVPALQAILFGRSDLNLFFSPTRDLEMHFLLLCKIAKKLKCPVLVFGAPKNRHRGTIDLKQALDIAADRFKNLSKVCGDYGVTIGIEPNPKEYGCDFINTLSEASDLCNLVSMPNFKTHIDTGSIEMNGEDVKISLKKYLPQSAHVHISQPFLADFSTSTTYPTHTDTAKFLHETGYNKWLSIEMKRQNGLKEVQSALEFAQKAYLSNC